MSKKKLGAIRGRRVNVANQELVDLAPLQADVALPLLVAPRVDGVDLHQWCAQNRGLIDEKLLHHGGLLLRDFNVGAVADFERLVQGLSGDLLQYTYRSTPRSEVEGRIYTSTEYPAEQWIPMHNEMSYSRSWPMKICFYCAVQPETGGQTPIADSRKVYQRLDPELRARFEAKGVMYVRNYGAGLDLSWQNVFQTDDSDAVEAFCAESGIELEWLGGDRLRTRQVCQAVTTHPREGSKVWFNQAHLFHVSSLPPALRNSLLASAAMDELPRNSFYGDGSDFQADELEHVREVFRQEMVLFPWQQGDVLLLDNVLAAHGRAPFGGARKILVGMGEPYTAAA